MRSLKISLMVLVMVVSLSLSTIGMAEARNCKNNNNHQQYSQNYYGHQNHRAKLSNNHYNRYNKNHYAQYGKIQRAKHIKQAHRYRRNNGNLYSGFDSGRGWTVVVGCD